MYCEKWTGYRNHTVICTGKLCYKELGYRNHTVICTGKLCYKELSIKEMKENSKGSKGIRCKICYPQVKEEQKIWTLMATDCPT